MVKLLSKLFIKNNKDYENPDVRREYGVLCGALGIALNIILFCAKFFIGSLISSIAVTADAFNNLSDAGASLITLIGFKLAGTRADSQHPFGHGRIEYISGLVVAMIIMLMGLELARDSVVSIFNPEPIEFNYAVIFILLFAIAVKVYMCIYNNSIGKKISSPAMRATGTDSLSDCIATSAVLLATLAGHFFNVNIDGYCGLLVAVFIMIAGIKAAKDTISPLLGQPPEPSYVKHIEDIVMSHDIIIGIHDLIVHNYGPGRIIVSLHAEVPANDNILDVHDTIDNIERDLRDELGCQAVIHMDPVVTDDIETNEVKADIKSIVKTIHNDLTIHDFRMVKGPTHTNVIFDVVVPYSVKMSDKEVVDNISNEIRNLDGNYFAVIEVDRNFQGK